MSVIQKHTFFTADFTVDLLSLIGTIPLSSCPCIEGKYQNIEEFDTQERKIQKSILICTGYSKNILLKQRLNIRFYVKYTNSLLNLIPHQSRFENITINVTKESCYLYMQSLKSDTCNFCFERSPTWINLEWKDPQSKGSTCNGRIKWLLSVDTCRIVVHMVRDYVHDKLLLCDLF